MNRYKYTNDYKRTPWKPKFLEGDCFSHLLDEPGDSRFIHFRLISQKTDGSWKIHMKETGYFEYLMRASGSKLSGDVTEQFITNQCKLSQWID